MSDTLFIITTYELPDENPSSDGLLFHPNRTEPLKTIKLQVFKDHLLNERSTLFRLKPLDGPTRKSLVFGHPLLDKEKLIPNKVPEKFIQALIEDICHYLSAEEKEKINSIKFILHGSDIREGGDLFSFLNEENPVVRKLMNPNGPFHSLVNQFFGKKPQLFSLDLNEENTNPLDLEFIVFQHETSSFYDLLLNYDSVRESYSTIKAFEDHLKLMLDFERSFLKKDEERKLEFYSIQNEKLLELLNHFDLAFFSPSNSFFKLEEGLPKHYFMDSVFVGIQDLLKPNLNYSTSEGKLPINIVFTPLKSVEKTSDLLFYKAVVEKLHSKDDEKSHQVPTIFIGYHNIMSDGKELIVIDDQKVLLDPRYRFLDSSIWYRYVAIESFENSKSFEKNLHSILMSIFWAYENQLYSSNICREFVELSNRLILNSYLDGKFGGGHASQVFPFTFHSETFMENRAISIYEDLANLNLKWNFLLVDDYARNTLKGKERLFGSKREKGVIIHELLKKVPYDKKLSFELCQNFEKEPKIKKAKGFLLEMADEGLIFDIILLDFLFTSNQETPTIVEYGTELLLVLSDEDEKLTLNKAKGVLQSFWIYPVSVFPEAMHSTFQEKSLQHLEEDWQLARGADPINTPHLFRCSLFEFMKVQSEKLYFTQEDIWSFLLENPLPVERDTDTKNWGKLVNGWALRTFRKFLERFSAIEGVPEGSALGNTAKGQMQQLRVSPYHLMEHVRQLLFMLAYSTGFDFPIIEREFEQIMQSFNIFKDRNKRVDGFKEEKLQAVEIEIKNLAKAVYRIDYKYF